MKKNDYERIEKQLSPDDKLIQSVMEKAEMFSAEPEKSTGILKRARYQRKACNKAHRQIRCHCCGCRIGAGVRRDCIYQEQ